MIDRQSFSCQTDAEIESLLKARLNSIDVCEHEDHVFDDLGDLLNVHG